jgi:hypothetical protein
MRGEVDIRGERMIKDFWTQDEFEGEQTIMTQDEYDIIKSTMHTRRLK